MGHVASPAPDWEALHEEALDLLQQYLRIDTSNPPGNEIRAVEFLADLLEREGIPHERYGPDASRVSLRAVLPGDGSRQPFMLLNHTDVVPVERASWTVDPFAAAIQDGHIWGRGALDMKGLGIAQLMTFLAFKRLGIPLARDVVFYAMADEEAGGIQGIEWLAANHPETLEAEYVINEGGGGLTETLGVERPVFSVAVSEKGPLWLRLVAEGRPGHGSVPHDDNAVDRLIRAMARIQEWQREPSISPILGEYFSRLAAAGIFRHGAGENAILNAARDDGRLRALLTNTISATSLDAGIKVNVIPGRAEATLDCRLLPGTDADAFQAELAAVINDEQVRIERIFQGSSGANPFETELFATIERVVREHVEDAVVVPSVTLGFTDSREFRRRGTIAYGFSGALSSPAVAATVHGHDERISLESFRLSCRVIYEVTAAMCVAR